jgi:DNA polymerase-1
MISFDELVKQQKLSDFSEVDLKKAAQYSAEDVYITNLIFKKQKEEKIVDNKILKEIEIPLIEVLKQMEID